MSIESFTICCVAYGYLALTIVLFHAPRIEAHVGNRPLNLDKNMKL